MELKKDHRILFLLAHSYWKANPNCVSLVERCERDKLPFDLYCPGKNSCKGEGKEIADWLWLVRRVFPSALKNCFLKPWKAKIIWNNLVHFFELKEKLKQKKYDLIVTCDPTGLSLLKKLGFSGEVPLVYLSFHILFRSELTTKNTRALADSEKSSLLKISLALSQDPNRRTKLSQESGLAEEVIQCVAVAPEQRPFRSEKSPILNSKSKMVLYCGNIETWNLESGLEEVAAQIPEEFCLRIHTHFAPSKSFIRRINKIKEKHNLEFSYAFLTEEELVHLVDQSYVGLAPYFPQDSSWMVNQTLYHIGKASTKIAYYCMRKKPVITTKLPSLNLALSKYPFGISIGNWSEVGSAINDIDANYSRYSEEAYRYYESELNPTQPIETFWQSIKGLMPRP